MKSAQVTGIALLLVSGIVAACSVINPPGKDIGSSADHSVITVVQEKAAPARGDLDLYVYFSLKTHKPGIGLKKDNHGSPDYKVFLKIDGQIIPWQGALLGENSEPRGLIDPEAGDGIRYQFKENLRLRAGLHTISLEIPEDGIAVTREVTLVAGEVNNLVVKPLYGQNPGMRRSGSITPTSFKQGIKGVRLFLNGREI